MAKAVSRKSRRAAHPAARAARKRRQIRVPYSAADVRLLKQHSKAKTPIKSIAKAMKRTEGSLRQKAMTLGIPLGHRR